MTTKTISRKNMEMSKIQHTNGPSIESLENNDWSGAMYEIFFISRHADADLIDLNVIYFSFE